MKNFVPIAICFSFIALDSSNLAFGNDSPAFGSLLRLPRPDSLYFSCSEKMGELANQQFEVGNASVLKFNRQADPLFRSSARSNCGKLMRIPRTKHNIACQVCWPKAGEKVLE